MSYLGNLVNAVLGRREPKGFRAAAFPGADIGRLTGDWTTDPGAINRWLRYELRTMRARARALSRGESYGAKFVRSCVDNIAGPQPFTLQAKVRMPYKGVLDESANKTIEIEWKRWGRVGECEITKKMSISAVHRLLVRSLARDGEALYRILRGKQFGYYGMKLQLLDIDRLDEDRNEERVNGAIKMGVQVDNYGAPVAYHLLRKHPGETGLWGPQPVKDYDVVPANDVRHLYLADWPEQVRGFPWIHAAMVRLYHLGAFEEAAVIAARIGASQMIMLEQTEQSAPLSSIADGPTNAGPQQPQVSVQPGTAQALPYGWKVATGWDPRFPDAAIEPFIRSCLRGIAAGVGMAYHSFANDPANVNYSTARVALIEERDMWSSIQQWYVEHNCEPLYMDWLNTSSLNGALPDGYRQSERFEGVRFQAKRWDWVDPKNEVEADVAALEAKLTSRTRIAAARGEDIEEIVEELGQEKDMMSEAGVEDETTATAVDSQGSGNGGDAGTNQSATTGAGRVLKLAE